VDLGFVSTARVAGVWLLATTATIALVAGLLPALHLPVGGRFDSALVQVSAAVALAVSVWLWLVTTLVTLDALRGRGGSRRGVPDGVRRVVLLLCGAALTAGLAAPAGATGGAPTGPEVLRGLRLPERIGVAHAPPAPRPAAAVPAAPDRVVRPGDTLWSLTAERLGPDATPARIAAAWPRLYAANRDVIGPDPAHIEPGQHLTLPTPTTRTEGPGHDRH
jgi:hypothetical protein